LEAHLTFVPIGQISIGLGDRMAAAELPLSPARMTAAIGEQAAMTDLLWRNYVFVSENDQHREPLSLLAQ
jgi:hypothetical protein